LRFIFSISFFSSSFRRSSKRSLVVFSVKSPIFFVYDSRASRIF
jgi:hypothetical protein